MTFTQATSAQRDRLYSLLRQMAVDGIKNTTGLTPEIVELPSLSVAAASRFIADAQNLCYQAMRLRRDSR